MSSLSQPAYWSSKQDFIPLIFLSRRTNDYTTTKLWIALHKYIVWRRPHFLKWNNISTCVCSGLTSNTICKAGIFSHSFLLYKTINPLQLISLIVECKLPIKDLRVWEDTYQTDITHALIPSMLSTKQFKIY